MKSYNGFPPEQRWRALAWLKAEYAAGRRRRPTVCEACDSRRKVMAHSEDYREPFGDHIGAFDVCWRCHMWIHLRFRDPDGFEAYRLTLPVLGRELFAMIRAGDFNPNRRT